MYAVGRLGSYITQGVYTVSGPFHPFGGAVDIVVVQQQDGSLKSSPWYIKFGKFQGVLKAKERVVDINVNGVDADFHMYLDPRGEAYFLREVDSEEVVDAVSLHSPSCEEIDGKGHDRMPPAKSKSLNYDFDHSDSVGDVSNGKVLTRTDSKRSRILGFVLGRRSMQEHSLSKEEDDSNREHAEIAADLLEMKWSTNLSSRNSTNDRKEPIEDNGGESIGGRLDGSLVLHEQHFVNKMETSSGVDDETCVVNKEAEVENSRTQLDDCNEAEVGIITSEEPLTIAEKICTEVAATQQGEASVEVVSCSSVCLSEDDKPTMQLDETNEIRVPLEPNGEFQDVSGDSLLIKQVPESFVEEQLIFGDLGDSKPSINKTEQVTLSVSTSEVDGTCSESLTLKRGPYPPPLPVRTRQEHLKVDIEGQKVNIRRSPSHADIPKNCEVAEKGLGRQVKSLPNLWTPFDDSGSHNEDSEFYSPAARFRSNWDLVREDMKKSNSEQELRLSDPQSPDTLSKDRKGGSIASDGSSGAGAGGSWNLWPFRRLGIKNVSQKEEENIKKDSHAEAAAEMDADKETSSPKSNKMHTRSLAPTAEQLASLNLAEGKNTVIFTFSTSVLGAQKVDARIYLWRWDTRIVISDVDGTITKSDVLGQFMPLVGRDWSHIGVTHLFSAIKENGYQMLYLSARAISQASITRQFLFNLKQDGEALPDGPVVISPDGLFPSLFREVIRRAPHEFKIACLEDIKGCFPSDRNPFYAGFGNRDTDEFSYLKVGISKGKIFIINPKGEVVVNRCIDSKSYASLHALVNGIFPPISVHEEQEDYNSWNFWKLPPPTIE